MATDAAVDMQMVEQAVDSAQALITQQAEELRQARLEQARTKAFLEKLTDALVKANHDEDCDCWACSTLLEANALLEGAP